MLTVISPAKKLDFNTEVCTETFTLPEDLDRSEQLINKLRRTSGKQIQKLMSLSKDLTQLNVERYQNWTPNFEEGEARQSLFAFNGEVYRGLDAATLKAKEVDFAQDHLRILSGLHGLLRPLDLIKPYRLEMGSKLSVRGKKNLYQFWGDSITERLNEQLAATNSDVLVNLASAEYFDSINLEKLNARVVEPVFKDEKNGEFKILFAYAKLARGWMTGYILRNQIQNPEDLRSFEKEGYKFNLELSSEHQMVFTR